MSTSRRPLSMGALSLGLLPWAISMGPHVASTPMIAAQQTIETESQTLSRVISPLSSEWSFAINRSRRPYGTSPSDPVPDTGSWEILIASAALTNRLDALAFRDRVSDRCSL